MQELPKIDTESYEVSNGWKNGADRLAWHKVARNLLFVKKQKKPISVKGNKVKCNKMKYAYIFKMSSCIFSYKKSAIIYERGTLS